jgi:hypothetical protein
LGIFKGVTFKRAISTWGKFTYNYDNSEILIGSFSTTSPENPLRKNPYVDENSYPFHAAISTT